MNSFYSEQELTELGLGSVGKDVLISRKASIYDAASITVGNHVRIDDFCILSGRISIGSHIHISAYTGIWAGKSGVVLEDFVSVSGRCCIYGKSDDYSGEYMTNPMVDEKYTNVTDKAVVLKKHSIVGSGSVVLPGVIVGEGCAVGCMSLINVDTEPWKIYAGIPVRILKDRSKELLRFEKDMTSEKDVTE